jgi:hypothetical protein
MIEIGIVLIIEEVFGKFEHVKNRYRLKELQGVNTRVAIDQNSTSSRISNFFKCLWR